MARSVRMFMLASALALSTTGCVNQPFRAAVAKFGTQTDAAMKAQSAELALVVAGEEKRIRSTLAESRTSLRFGGGCGVAPVSPGQTVAPCTLKAFVSASVGSEDVEKLVVVSNIVKLQDALADYGTSLALLAESTSGDTKKFAEAAAGLAASVGKLDGAITKVAGSDRTVSDADLGIVANTIAKIAGIVFALERERALKNIILNTDPFVQRAIARLELADRQDVQILVSRATRTANAQLAAYNRAVASPTSTLADRQAAIDALFASIDGINALSQRQSQIHSLGQVHAALAKAASPTATRREMALAIEQLIRWNSGQPIGSPSVGER